MIQYLLDKASASPFMMGLLLTFVAKFRMTYRMAKPDAVKRIARFNPHHVLPHVGRHKPPVRILGKRVKLNTKYLGTFRQHGITCAGCGMEGKWIYLEHSTSMDAPGNYSFKLYGINAEGYEIQMTRDHVIPVSRGGRDGLYNSQPMCYDCNQRKGNTLPYKQNKRNKRHVTART